MENLLYYASTLESKLECNMNALKVFKQTKISYFQNIARQVKEFRDAANREITLLRLNINGSTPYSQNSRYK